jgi:hypothetical protein
MAIDLQPHISSSIGEPRVTPKGRPLQGVNSSTYCTFELAEGSDRRLMPALRASNARLISRARQIRSFLRSGGTLEYFIALFVDENSGLVLEPEIVKQAADLDIRLAFDIYPG